MSPVFSALGKLANIEGSLRQYIVDNLSGTFSSGNAIDFGGGEPFDDTQHAEWLQVRLLEPARPDVMLGPRDPDGLLAREYFVMVNLNIFIRPAKVAIPNSLRLQTLRDIVVRYFTPNTKISVKDYAGDSATLGQLLLDRIDADRWVPQPTLQDQLLQWNFILSFRWIERWETF